MKQAKFDVNFSRYFLKSSTNRVKVEGKHKSRKYQSPF